jgi:transposase
MNNTEAFELKSESIESLPIINHFFNRLDLDEYLKCAMPDADPSNHIMPHTSISILLRNMAISRMPVYGFNKWVSAYDPHLFNITSEQLEHINDDRFGRALDQLFDTDRASLMTKIVLKAIHEFDLNMDQFHNDSTSITFHGNYKNAVGKKVRGKETLKITHGHNKDHRPDLKQLVFDLTVTSDGAVPIHYKGYDGNRTDDTTHIENWDTLCKLKGSPDFVYVADSKLCVSDSLKYINGKHGFFITVMPRTRSEDKWFRDYLVNNDVIWNEIYKIKDPRKKTNPPVVWRMMESPIPSNEGFRIVWVWNSKKAIKDQKSRQRIIDKAISGLKGLQERLQKPRCRLKKKESIYEEAEKIIKDVGASDWFDIEVIEKTETTHKQEKRGRPGPNTRYVAMKNISFQVNWNVKRESVARVAWSDGIFPLITNCYDMPLKDILDKYKYQPKLEKRHEQLKTVYGVAPVLLKNVTRIEPLLFLFFIVLLVQSLIEREIRLKMKEAGVAEIPIYPEKRQCTSPTTDKLLDLFANVQRHHLYDNGIFIKTFSPTLTEVQTLVLDLLEMPQGVYSEYTG